VTPEQVAAYPLLALLSAVAARQVATLPPLAVPGGRLTVTAVDVVPDGLAVHMTAVGRLAMSTQGTANLRVTSVGTDHAYLAVDAAGGLAFRAAVNAALSAGGVLEPLVRALLGRPLRQGIEMHGRQIRIAYADLVAGPHDAP
jgi:hypothetical protein